MKVNRARLISWLLLGALGLGGARAGAQAVEHHGADSTFTAEGLAVMWAVLRGQDEDSTLVHLRIAKLSAGADAYGFFSLVSVDPFSGESREELRAAPLLQDNRVVRPRSSYRDFSSKRLLFHKQADAAGRLEAELTIYYLGLPDTTPEFVSLAALEAYLEDTLRRLAGAAAAP